MKSSVEEEGFSVEEGKPRSNVILGTVGAILGALLGSIIWVVIYQFGYIAALAGIAIVIGAFKGYTLLSKRNDIKAAVISIVVSVIVVFLAHCFCWGLDIYNAFSGEIGISFFEALKAVPQFVFSPDLIGDFLLDLIIGYFLMAVGSFTFIRTAIKNADKKPAKDDQPILQ